MKIAIIADIHFNAVKAEKLYHQLDEIFLNYLRNNEIDMVVIAGDYYDSIVSLNSKTAKLSMEFMTNLVDIANLRGIRYIRIIKGTSSHDNNQLENLKIFESNDGVDIKIFDTVTSEEIDGYRVLYLPEEYMKNVGEFYEDYFDTKYDMIFGHGMFKETSFTASKQNSAITLSKAPVFDSKKMESICTGPIVFGHIHSKTNIDDRIFYPGSFSRWVYGEEDSKGFMVFDINKEGFQYRFIENTLAEKYDTITITNINNYESEPEKFINEMKNFLINHLRIIIILHGQHDYSYIVNLLKEYYAKKPEYRLMITDKTEVIRQVEQEKRLDDLMKKYEFIFSNNISRVEKISKFIKVRDKEDVSIDDIKRILRLE